MTQEQKARAYDEAREKVAIRFGSNVADEIFSQFEMSDDEKIRKELLNAFQESEDSLYMVLTPHRRESFIAWLEKQGEQNYKIIKGKNYFCVKTHNYAGVEWIKGTKYYASDNYTLVNQGCEYYCPEYSKEEHNNLFEEVKCDGCVEKQGEQKPADNIESSTLKNKLLELFQRFRWYCKDKTPTNGDIIEYVDAHIQELIDTVNNEPTEWTEEDELTRDALINLVEMYYGGCIDKSEKNRLLNWLKSLKDIVQPQKQEWSEKDEHWRQKVIDFMKHPDLIKATPTLAKDTIDWIKSLRLQTTWKPNEEQMTALKEVIDVGYFTSCPNGLETLYKQLIKQL